MNVKSYKFLMEISFTVILSEYQCIYKVSSSESEGSNTRRKAVAKIALKLKKSDLNVYMGIRNCCKKKMLFDPPSWVDLLFK